MRYDAVRREGGVHLLRLTNPTYEYIMYIYLTGDFPLIRPARKVSVGAKYTVTDSVCQQADSTRASHALPACLSPGPKYAGLLMVHSRGHTRDGLASTSTPRASSPDHTPDAAHPIRAHESRIVHGSGSAADWTAWHGDC